ncbi:MAG: hypothetical protein E6I73_16530 [Chloroflexi bacterium]|nr:MAG: hypothetical protein E6I73_16530 [Chloroflexota bacterium]
MQERSEEQIISRLLELENSGQAERRAELSGERYIALIQDPETSGGYILQHGLDETEGAEVPEGTEFWDYGTWDEARAAYEQLLNEARAAGELVEDDTVEGIGDSETGGAEVRDRYSASDEDPLVAGDERQDTVTDESDSEDTP